MAKGSLAGTMTRFAAGLFSEIDTKNTMKYMKRNHDDMMKASKAYRFGRNVSDFTTGGITSSIRSMGELDNKGAKNGLWKGIVKGHSRTIANEEMAKQYGKKIGETMLDGKKVLGTAVAVTGAGRIVSGGGLYRDKNGNTNIPIVPFI